MDRWSVCNRGQGQTSGTWAATSGRGQNKPFAYSPNPVLTVREIKLGRAQVHSEEDGNSYLIPVVVFEADVVDANGEVRQVSALVSAIRTEP